MGREDNHASAYARPGYRLVSAAFGVMLVGAGFYVLLSTAPEMALEMIGAIGLALLGANHLLSAYAGTEPWLSRIGPLP